MLTIQATQMQELKITLTSMIKPVYERSSTYISERSNATSNIDASTIAHLSIKMNANIRTIQYCNAVVVKDTGDIYAEPNK